MESLMRLPCSVVCSVGLPVEENNRMSGQNSLSCKPVNKEL